MRKTIIYRGSVVFDKHPKNFLKNSIKTLRTWFDGEVIVSTWDNQEKNLIGIDNIDKVIISKDPGEGPIQNFKRQVLSYQKGVESSTGDLILVTRTDVIHNKDIFKYINDCPKFNQNFKVFKNKLLIGNMMSINPLSNENPNTFRLSDWFHLGFRSDIENWGDIYDMITNNNTIYSCTEKTWFIYFLIKNNIIEITETNTNSIDNLYWDYIISNFIIKNTRSTLNSFNMNWDFQPENLNSYITEKEYMNQYNLRFNI